MIIDFLILENFGAFKGVQKFDFSPIYENGIKKPIILIGGMNGSGKTTLFEAIRLCLYGQSIDGYRFSQKDYDEYINGYFHSMMDTPLQSENCSIELKFSYTQYSKTDSYIVKRSWIKKTDGISENLDVKKNGENIGDIELFQWQTFISELIPPGISQLFFFDGEKIQNLADDETTIAHVQESFKGLLDLHIVERLRSDLGIFIQKKTPGRISKALHADLESLKNTREELEKQVLSQIQQKAQLKTRYSQLLNEIERQELIIASEGGGFAERRDVLKSEKIHIEHEIESHRQKIRELCSYLFPFSLTPKYCKQLKENIEREETFGQWQQSKIFLDNELKEIEGNLSSISQNLKEQCSPEVRKEIQFDIIQTIREKIANKNEFKDFTPIHQFSSKESHTIHQWIETSIQSLPNEMRKWCSSLEELVQKRDSIVLSLQRAPDDDILSPLIVSLNEMHSERGAIEQKLSVLEEQIRLTEYTLRDVDRKKTICLEEISSYEGLSDQLQLANSVQIVLEEYMRVLQKNKSDELKSNFLKIFNYLLRKEEYVTDIDIDLEKFLITLYDRNGTPIPKKKLSLGEKQIFAISMLWALTNTSSRQLPFIIDTPLGRLDSDHRTNLIQEFFPKASDQMIIFSTDTEIDLPYFIELSPSIARSYHLDFNSKDGATIVTPGYFWNPEEEAVI